MGIDFPQQGCKAAKPGSLRTGSSLPAPLHQGFKLTLFPLLCCLPPAVPEELRSMAGNIARSLYQKLPGRKLSAVNA